MCRESLIDFSKYEIHEDGTIFSTPRNRNLKCFVSKSGYSYVSLRCKGDNSHTFQWHRVIYYYFKGDIPEGIHVNHIDEDKSNNALSNLNLMTPKQNANHGTRNKRISVARAKFHVLQYNLKTNEPIKIWLNMYEIKRELGYNVSVIYSCCKGGHFNKGKWQNNTKAYGFGWKFI